MLVGRQHVVDDGGVGTKGTEAEGGAEAEEKEKKKDEGRKLRKKEKRKYDVDGSDTKYFKSLERGEVQLRPGEGSAHRRDEGKTVEELGRRAVYAAKCMLSSFSLPPFLSCSLTISFLPFMSLTAILSFSCIGTNSKEDKQSPPTKRSHAAP